jgi:CubicO group peptidase (beta-lactamase class C family)
MRKLGIMGHSDQMREIIVQKIIAILCVCLLAAALAAAPLSPTISIQPAEARMMDVDGFIAHMQEAVPEMLFYYDVPGAAVALVNNGEVVWTEGFGQADIKNNRPVKADTVFQAASISKTFTAWGVMKLVEEGRLDLNAPVEKYFVRWHLPPSQYDLNGVTIRRLLTHDAGLSIARYKGYPPGTILPSIPEEFDLLAKAGNGIYVENPPGKEFRYSDSNFLLLMLAIEDVTGEPFAEYMQREILDPLGLTSSSFEWLPELQARTAVGYDSYLIPYNEYLYVEKASAGLYTTAGDLARFVAAAMPGPNGEPPGRGVLSPETIAEMTSYQVDIQGTDNWIYSDAYGFGYFVETLPSGQKVISHMGGNPGWLSEFAAIPETGDGIVVFTNITHGHAVFADVVTEWTDWLGVGRVRVAGTILFSRYVFDLISTFLGVGGLLLISPVAAGLVIRKRKFCFDFKCMPFLRLLGLIILPIAGLIFWWELGYRLVQVSLPSQQDWIGIGVTVLLSAMLLRGISVRVERD